ncbi:MAG: lectin like domain-containing protein [Verrucomicrobiota bacterium]
MKRHRFLTVGFVVFVIVSATLVQALEIAPLNPEFKQYQQKLMAKTLTTRTTDGHGLGHIPAPFKLPQPAASFKVQQGKPKALPTSYDLRNDSKVSPVRNQGIYGNCWAFATFGSMESCLLTAETWDFSENNLSNKHGYDSAYGGGGNHYMSLAYLGRWGGPVLESDDPYSNGSYSPSGLTVQKHIQSAQFIPDRTSSTDNDAIKQAVMTYGGLYSAFCYNSAYYNSANYAYYYSGAYVSGWGHAITIIGWDDAFSRFNFKTTPAGDGAFLIKNSWDTSWGDEGYFWISYYDAHIGNDNCLFLNAESTANYESVYQYDTLGMCTAYGGLSTTAWGANIFSEASGTIEAVSFYAAAAGASYEIRVYTGVTAGSPTSGTLSATKSGTVTYGGYYTVTLDSPVTYSTRFSVVVKFTTPGSLYPIPVEYPIADYSSAASASSGESYISADGSSWEEAYYGGEYFNVCIKAFGTGGEAPTPTPTNTGAINDYDGDGKTDYSLYGWMNGKWSIWSSYYGRLLANGDKWGDYRQLPVSGDFNGGGATDVAVYSLDDGYWYIYYMETGTYYIFQWGGYGYCPVAGDYDGDGKTDYALYYWPDSTWYIWSSLYNRYLVNGAEWGGDWYIPVSGDFDGDGKSDIAVYSEDSGYWKIYFIGTGLYRIFQWGGLGLRPACGDYDGDGKTDYALYYWPAGYWYIWSSLYDRYLVNGEKWGGYGYLPVPGDFDGGGIADIAVYAENYGYWLVYFTETGLYSIFTWGEYGYSPPYDWVWYY